MAKFDTKVQLLKYKVLKEVARLAWKDQLLDHVMDNGFVRLNAENGFGKFNLADLLAGHIVNVRFHSLNSPFLSGFLRKPSAGSYERKPSAG